jgi:hypothetical protein
MLIPARIVRAERGSCEAITATGIVRAPDRTHACPGLGERRFTDCAHVNEPGCAVLAAVAAGEIPQRRLDSYQRLLRENAHAASRTDARLRADREATKKEITRHLRATYRFRERQQSCTWKTLRRLCLQRGSASQASGEGLVVSATFTMTYTPGRLGK